MIRKNRTVIVAKHSIESGNHTEFKLTAPGRFHVLILKFFGLKFSLKLGKSILNSAPIRRTGEQSANSGEQIASLAVNIRGK